jgi:NAD(P)-dependent dehydrogenase (short-subunit alcohol dehydrogenase family)
MGAHRQHGIEHFRLGDTGFVHYVASKGGVIGFTRALAGDVAADEITVNAIAAGLTRSPGTLVRKPRPGFNNMEEDSRRSNGRKCQTI